MNKQILAAISIALPIALYFKARRKAQTYEAFIKAQKPLVYLRFDGSDEGIEYHV